MVSRSCWSCAPAAVARREERENNERKRERGCRLWWVAISPEIMEIEEMGGG